jgi:RNA polymerase subunit RPABC4/transcription elongation factor Spt4
MTGRVAVLKCKECGGDLSAEATACPQCTSDAKVSRRLIFRWDLWLVAIALGVLAWLGLTLL